MQKFIRAILYVGAGLVLFAVLFCLVALLPFLDLNPQDAAYAGAAFGAVVGLVYGFIRKFA